MREILTDDEAMVEQMVAKAKHFGARLNVEKLDDGRFRLTMSNEDMAKLAKVDD
ncbi:MAG: hypothetical protein R3E02_11485 [Blastomonas sp.]